MDHLLGLLSNIIPIFRVVSEMRRYDAKFKALVFLVPIFIASGEDAPCRRSRFDPNHLEHDSSCLGEIAIDVGLVSSSEQPFDLVG